MLRPTISRRVCLEIEHPFEAYDQIFITVRQLRLCWCGALSLTRGPVCRLQLLMALANAVILGSESSGNRDHILLSQIRDFPFRLLLRLVDLRWRHSTPPPRRIFWLIRFCTTYIVSRRAYGKHIHCPPMDICEPHRKHRFLYCYIYSVLHRNGNYPIVARLFVVAYCWRLYLATICLPRICLRGNMFIEPLPSSRTIRHNILFIRYY
jgi:hypothetical protein